MKRGCRRFLSQLPEQDSSSGKRDGFDVLHKCLLTFLVLAAHRKVGCSNEQC